MDCLHPTISSRLALLIEGLSTERRQAVLEIARGSCSWQDFLEVLQQGGFPLPESLKTAAQSAGPQIC